MDRRRLAVGVAVAVLLASCGGGDDGAGSTTGTEDGVEVDEEPEDPAEVEALVVGGDVLEGGRALAVRFGVTDGAAAVLYAVERGYPGVDIVGAAATDRLESDGTILDESGVVTVTNGPPAGVLVLPEGGTGEQEESSPSEGTPIGLRSSALATPVDEPLDEGAMQELLAAAAARIARLESVVDEEGIEIGEAAVVVVILGLVNTGYSAEQIIEFLVLGGQGAFTAEDIRESPGSVGCIVLATSDENAELVPVIPARGLNDNCPFDAEQPAAATTAPAAESTESESDGSDVSAGDVAGTYFGTATVSLSFPGTETFEGTECSATPEVELTLGTDNSAVLTVVWTNFVATPPQPAGEGCEILEAVYDSPTLGSWSGDQVDVSVRTPRRGLEAPITATIGDGEVAITDASLTWVDRPETGTMTVVLERLDD